MQKIAFIEHVSLCFSRDARANAIKLDTLRCEERVMVLDDDGSMVATQLSGVQALPADDPILQQAMGQTTVAALGQLQQARQDLDKANALVEDLRGQIQALQASLGQTVTP